ncbi:MAG TPA: hypothetical protein VNP03_11725 [Pseudonocardia sp.]|nr:hypothetical protein [Pseudonocardia sp.]
MSPDASVTLASVLGDGEAGQAAQVLQRGLTRIDAGTQALQRDARCGPVAFRLADERVAEALGDRLTADVGGLLLQGWLKHRELVDAATRTRDVPGRPEDVILVTHEVSYLHKFPVEVWVNGGLVVTLDFQLALALELSGVVAVVDRGRLVALRSGDVLATARVTLWDQDVANGKRELFAGVLLPLREGFPLVSLPSTSTASTPSATPASTPGWPATPTPTPSPTPTPTLTPAPAAGSKWWERAPAQSPAAQSTAAQSPAETYQWPKPREEPSPPWRPGGGVSHE